MSAEVEKLLADEWRRWSDSQPQLIRPLSGGLTNRSFLLQAGGDKLVLRINAGNSRALDLDRAAEADALRLASARHLCAPLVYIDPDHRYLLTRFVDGVPMDLNQSEALAQVAQLLRQIHQLPPISARLDIADKANRYWQSIDRSARFFPALSKLHARMESLLRRTSNPQTYRLCHNDLLPENLIVDNAGQLRAIDWEYAALGEPFFDLATVAQGYRLNQQQQQGLLAAYLQRPVEEADRHKLAHWQRMYRYLSALWYAVQASKSAPESANLSMGGTALSAEITDLLAAFE
ncbi:choline kinase family protein [Microbulbifer bruguierae]|uniref:Choline kinase family protein n=1 Tax=Microbulbifer bruguierae TaxID=3029061 RepID=A0ABY8NGD4_9GAMM|nr:choline kinase family protein [Microbulbifer bruguierae]WGL18000.1 choline kinase family protein [Microbulbifer bruguierae]